MIAKVNHIDYFICEMGKALSLPQQSVSVCITVRRSFLYRTSTCFSASVLNIAVRNWTRSSSHSELVRKAAGSRLTVAPLRTAHLLYVITVKNFLLPHAAVVMLQVFNRLKGKNVTHSQLWATNTTTIMMFLQNPGYIQWHLNDILYIVRFRHELTCFTSCINGWHFSGLG